MSPESLRRRLAHGNVYAAEKVDAALAQLLPRRQPHRAARAGAALGGRPGRRGPRALPRRARHRGHLGGPRAHRRRAHRGARRARRCCAAARGIAGRSAGRVLLAVHVVRGDGTRGRAARRPRPAARSSPRTSAAPSTPVVGDDVATAVLDFARSVNATQLVVGASRRSRLSMALRPSTADADRPRLRRHRRPRRHARERGPRASAAATSQRRRSGRRLWSPGSLAVLLPVAVTVLLLPVPRRPGA